MPDTPRRPPQPAAPPNMDGTIGRPFTPFTPGRVIGKLPREKIQGSNLTPEERRLIEQAGGDPEDAVALHDTPLSDALAEQIEALRRNADKVEGTPVPADTPPIKIPEPVDINKLPPDKQAEIMKALDEAKAYQAAERDSIAPDAISQIPGMAEAYRTARGHPDDVLLVDDMNVEQQASPPPQDSFDPTAASAPAPEAVPFPQDTTSQRPAQEHGVAEATTEGNNPGSKPPDGFDPVEPPAPPPPAPPATPPAGAGGGGGGGSVRKTHCPQCHFDLSKDPEEISQHMKLSFVSSVLGEGRFRQEYKMFGGRMVVILRGLLPSELDLAQHQLAQDIQLKRVLTNAEYKYMFENYKLAMAIEKLIRDGAQQIFKPVAELPYDSKRFVTALPQLTDWFNNHVYKTDSVRRTIGQKWLTFGKIQDRLEARATDPDFWKAIEGAT